MFLSSGQIAFHFIIVFSFSSVEVNPESHEQSKLISLSAAFHTVMVRSEGVLVSGTDSLRLSAVELWFDKIVFFSFSFKKTSTELTI